MNNIIETLKSYELWSNTGYDYLLAILIFVGTLIILKIFQVIILSKLQKLAKKTNTDFDDVIIEIFRRIKPPFYLLVALYLGIKALTFPDLVEKIIGVIFLIVVVYEVIQGIGRIIDFFTDKYKDKMNGTEKVSQSMLRAMKIVVKIILWAIGIILILGNLGLDVTSLIAGLGIGGIAVALALQNILEDLFSSFSIYIDKPFRIGDYIQAGSDGGTVEKIGMKTTRLRTLNGEELVISNKELTNARVQNFRRMEKRRDAFEIGVTYETPADKLESIPKIIEEIITSEKQLEFVRCKFKSFGDSALIFEAVYFVTDKDMDLFLNVKERVNFKIYKRFNEEKIEFAYPTQTVFVNK